MIFSEATQALMPARTRRQFTQELRQYVSEATGGLLEDDCLTDPRFVSHVGSLVDLCALQRLSSEAQKVHAGKINRQDEIFIKNFHPINELRITVKKIMPSNFFAPGSPYAGQTKFFFLKSSLKKDWKKKLEPALKKKEKEKIPTEAASEKMEPYGKVASFVVVGYAPYNSLYDNLRLPVDTAILIEKDASSPKMLVVPPEELKFLMQILDWDTIVTATDQNTPIWFQKKGKTVGVLARNEYRMVFVTPKVGQFLIDLAKKK